MGTHKKLFQGVMLSALAAGGAYAVVKARQAYHGILRMVDTKEAVSSRVMAQFSQQYVYIGSDERFTGAAVGAVCCALRMEMEQAEISTDVEIELACAFSSVIIIVPKNVRVLVDCKTKMSGISVQTETGTVPAGGQQSVPTLRITGSAFMSGIMICSGQGQMGQAVIQTVTQEKPAEVYVESHTEPEQQETVDEEAVPEQKITVSVMQLEEPSVKPAAASEVPATEESAVTIVSLEDALEETVPAVFSTEERDKLMNKLLEGVAGSSGKEQQRC